MPPLPAPPDPFDPLLETWAAGEPLVRVHPLAYDSLSFNPSPSSGRFRPVHDADGMPVPTLYAANGFDGAISESAFHELPVKAGPKHLPRSLLAPLAVSRLRATRPLELVSLRGHGLRRLGVTQWKLIECGPDSYPQTAAWGQAAYEHAARLDGLAWISRQFPGGIALMLFGDRCGEALVRFEDEQPLSLAHGRGFELVCVAANEAGVVLVEG